MLTERGCDESLTVFRRLANSPGLLIESVSHFYSVSLIHTLSLTSSCDSAGGNQTERLVFNL